jgi:hypothetical protein
MDPLGQMMLGSEDYRAFIRVLQVCAGRSELVVVNSGLMTLSSSR